MGRFISRDPIGTSDDVNLYGYVGNDPINANDPDGRKAKEMIRSAGVWMGSAIWSLPEAFTMMEYAGGSDDDSVVAQQASTQRANMLLLVTGWIWATKTLWSIVRWANLSEEEIWMQKSLQDAIKWGNNGSLKQAIGWGGGRYIPRKIKDEIRERDGNTCVLCWVKTNTAKQTNPTKSEIDHSIPYSRWWSNSTDNLQNTCRTCNRVKSDSTTFEFITKFFQ